MTTMTAPIPVRRGSLTIAAIDAELRVLALFLRAEPPGEDRDLMLADADRWLDHRSELLQHRARIKKALG